MSHPASSNFSDVFATTDRYQYSGKEFDLAPFQSSSQKANPSVKTFVLQHTYDDIAKCEEMPGNPDRLVTHDDIPENLWERLKMSYTEHQVTSFALEEIKEILKNIIK
jgi:hypothetical protein